MTVNIRTCQNCIYWLLCVTEAYVEPTKEKIQKYDHSTYPSDSRVNLNKQFPAMKWSRTNSTFRSYIKLAIDTNNFRHDISRLIF